MWKQLQVGMLVLFAVLAIFTIVCQIRCGMIGGQITRAEATKRDLEKMQGQAKKAAIGAGACLVACMLFGALGMR